jgi:hypothetical protein
MSSHALVFLLAEELGRKCAWKSCAAAEHSGTCMQSQ